MMKIIGYSDFTSKKGNRCLYIHVTKDLTDFDRQYGAVGQRVDVLQLYGNTSVSLKPSDIGKEIEPLYDVSNNKAYLRSFIVK